MEPGHRQEVARIAPQLSGRVMLFDQWTGRQGIADPYMPHREFHELTFEQIREASKAWAERLSVVTGGKNHIKKQKPDTPDSGDTDVIDLGILLNTVWVAKWRIAAFVAVAGVIGLGYVNANSAYISG